MGYQEITLVEIKWKWNGDQLTSKRKRKRIVEYELACVYVPGSCGSLKGGDLRLVAFFCEHNLWDHHLDSEVILRFNKIASMNYNDFIFI